jgi:Spy/CpxP family protein refolding chaperone
MICFFTLAFAQEKSSPEDAQAAYIRVTNERADKIVAEMNIQDAEKADKLSDLIAQQYRNLSKIQDEQEAEIETLKKQSEGVDQAEVDAQIQLVEEKAAQQIDKLHAAYIKKLSAELTPEQVDEVKDGMTYGILPLTYNVYQEMIPDLTEEQKAQIKAYLTEAREHAMDAGSSEKKHWWFGKYKGKINNYLSAQGYDLKEEERAWAERREAASDQKEN